MVIHIRGKSELAIRKIAKDLGDISGAGCVRIMVAEYIKNRVMIKRRK